MGRLKEIEIEYQIKIDNYVGSMSFKFDSEENRSEMRLVINKLHSDMIRDKRYHINNKIDSILNGGKE